MTAKLMIKYPVHLCGLQAAATLPQFLWLSGSICGSSIQVLLVTVPRHSFFFFFIKPTHPHASYLQNPSSIRSSGWLTRCGIWVSLELGTRTQPNNRQRFSDVLDTLNEISWALPGSPLVVADVTGTCTNCSLGSWSPCQWNFTSCFSISLKYSSCEHESVHGGSPTTAVVDMLVLKSTDLCTEDF